MKRFRDTEYFVSSDGHIYRDGKVLQHSMMGNGYRVVNTSVNGKVTSHLVHRLVAECYIPNPENKSQVNHINGKKGDNSVSNLEWNTHTENMQHSVRTGLLKNSGEDHINSVLTNDQAEMIRQLYTPRSKTLGMPALSRKFNVSVSTIQNVIENKTYLETAS
tara:strand:+ start:59 stop:544 length:486 start_codon:yes stop_codon:yes gene_type:complete